MDLTKSMSTPRRIQVVIWIAVLTLFSGLPEVAKPADKLTNEDIVKMVKAGLGTQIILATIENQGGVFDLSPDALVSLKNAGVNDKIIAALIKSASKLAPKNAAPRASEVTLADGTEVTLRLLKAVSSATVKVEERVDFETAEDVMADGVVVIKKGAPAWGKVIQAKPKKSFGRSGKLDFTIDYVRSVDGQNLNLRSTREIKGDDSYGKAGVVTLLAGPLGFLVKGKNVEIDAGAEYTIFVDGDRTIRLGSGNK